MTKIVTIRVFFPTRFHIFNQLEMSAFAADLAGGKIEIYSVYPKHFVQRGRFSSLAPAIRSLWLGLALKGLLHAAGKLGFRGKLLKWLRDFYIAACAAEFRLRLSSKPAGLVLATAGYLGKNVSYLRKAGHTVVINHGSLYEPYVGRLMQALPNAAGDEMANWTNPSLVARMDVEFEQADGIIVCSPTALKSFPARLHEKISVAPLGAPTKSLGAFTAGANNATTFLHVSNLSFGKNVMGVLDAFSKIRGESDQLLIGGPAPRDAELYARLKNPEPGVVWLGRLDRAGVDAAMGRAHIFVHPSFADGWGMVITEALAAGLPVVASPDTGAASYYANASAEGAASVLLVDPADPKAIARAMDSLRNSIRADPSFRAVTPMSWGASAETLRDNLSRYSRSTS